MLIKVQVYALTVLLSAQIASQLITVLHAKMDTSFMNLRVLVIQVFVK